MSIIIDGSNVVRVLGKDRPCVPILSTILRHFRNNGTAFTVFLDAWLISHLRSISEHHHRQLIQLIDEYGSSIERGTGGQEADEPLLTFANFNPEMLILSRDRYRKYWERFPWLKDHGRLIPFNYLEAAKQLVVPGLNFVLTIDLEETASRSEVSCLDVPSQSFAHKTGENSMINFNSPFPGQTPPKRVGSADIVFCLDRTGSMQPCIDAVKNSIAQFVNSDLQTSGAVSFRVRLIAYGDLVSTTDTSKQDRVWLNTQFTDDIAKFSTELDAVVADGGGSDTDQESTLDAVYLAIKSPWRPKVHRAIIVFTDEDTYTNLSPLTVAHPGQDGVSFIIQQLQTLPHMKLFLVAPDRDAYQRISAAIRFADRQVQWMKLKETARGQIDTKRIDWPRFLTLIARDLSTTATAVQPSY